MFRLNLYEKITFYVYRNEYLIIKSENIVPLQIQ